jgi:hypothetical protein
MDDRERRLAHLSALAGGQAGALIRGLHSFMEDILREVSPPGLAGKSFVDRLAAFAESAARRAGAPQFQGLVKRLAAEHELAFRAAWSAAPPDANEAAAAAHNFLQFCELAGIDSPALAALEAFRDAWRRRPAQEPGAALQEVQAELVASQADERRILEQTAQWAEDKKKLAELEGEDLRLQAALARESAREAPSAERLDQVRAEARDLETRRTELQARLGSYRDLDLYVQHVSRFSLYTRSRRDYERGLLELTPEQEDAVEAMRPGHDMLVRGGAGTGKTIVLIHALARALAERSQELALATRGRVLLLTYTTTLVKYDRYIADVLRGTDAQGTILTVDRFLSERLELLGERQRVDYRIAASLAERLNTTSFFTPQEVVTEVEDFLFANLVTRQEYLEERIPRRGMRQPLSVGQREAVWAVRERMVEAMEHDGVLSRNYSRVKLISRLDGADEKRRAALRDIEVAFVDESQDLTAADLGALKRMSVYGLLMAGDAGQSIYTAGSPYKRAGIEIAGRARVLHTSFRTTVAIQEVTDAYRRLSGLEEDEDSASAAVRQGPIPELHLAASRDELARLLLRKAALFIERLGYDPENLAVLAPSKTDLAAIGDLLGHAGYRWANVRDDDFSFGEQGTIRLSTMHSSKGLDFAVVLLYLPALPPRESWDDATAALLVRNLVYVAMTRAMDNLNVFMLEGAHEGQAEEPLQDLLRVFRDQQRRWERKLLKPAPKPAPPG